MGPITEAIPLEPSSVTHEWFRLRDAGDPAWLEKRNRLVLMHTPLVVHTAKAFGRHAGLEDDDLIKMGQCGLMRALDLFDPGRGFQLSTYARYWIRQFISRGIESEAPLIHVPDYVQQLIRDGKKAQAKPAHPDLQKRIAAGAHALHSVAWGRSRSGDNLDVLESRTLAPSESAINRDHLLAHIDRTLAPRELRIVKLYFGLGGERPHTQKEIGKALGHNKREISRWLGLALAKLRRTLPAFREITSGEWSPAGGFASRRVTELPRSEVA